MSEVGSAGRDLIPPTPQQLADALPDGVVIADPSGVVTLVSALAARMLGPGAAAGRLLAEVLRLQDHDGHDWTTWNQPYRGLRTRTAVPEQVWVTSDGTEVLVTAKLHRAQHLGPVQWVVITLRSGRGRERLDRDRSDLVATLAHELRSPLTGVKGFVQAMLNRWDKLTDEQKKLMLTTVSADADRLARLIAELLDVARIDTGRLQMYRRPASAVVLVGRVVDSVVAGTARAIESTLAEDLPEVFVDPDKFTQVVTNLIENAVRHGDGLITVRVDHEHFDRPGEEAPDGVRVTVSDQGEGIAPELRRRVFTKFWTSGVRGGSGLGLYLVNGLVRAHGGAVEIDDAPGGGAVVSCTWPGVPAELAD